MPGKLSNLSCICADNLASIFCCKSALTLWDILLPASSIVLFLCALVGPSKKSERLSYEPLTRCNLLTASWMLVILPCPIVCFVTSIKLAMSESVSSNPPLFLCICVPDPNHPSILPLGCLVDLQALFELWFGG